MKKPCPVCGRSISVTDNKPRNGHPMVPLFYPHRPHEPDGKTFDFCDGSWNREPYQDSVSARNEGDGDGASGTGKETQGA